MSAIGTDNKVSSLRDSGEYSPLCCRKLKHTVNKVLSLQDIASHDEQLLLRCHKLKHTVNKKLPSQGAVSYRKQVSLIHYKQIHTLNSELYLQSALSRRDSTLLTVCFSLRTGKIYNLPTKSCKDDTKNNGNTTRNNLLKKNTFCFLKDMKLVWN
jgi:hypothetical protein